MKDLSPQQQKVYNFISQYCEINGRSPSIADICNGVGLANSTVFTYVETLRKKNRVTSEYGVHRSLRVVPETATAMGGV